MHDLVGGALTSLMLQELKPVLAKHPRFRSNDGEVIAEFGNLILYKDISLTMGGFTGSGEQMSPDNYMATAMGRATLVKLQGYEGSFIEWIKEVDATGQTPVAGLYYFKVTGVDEGAQTITLTSQTYRWISGAFAQAEGTVIYLDPKFSNIVVKPSNPALQFRAAYNSLVLLTYTDTLSLVRQDTLATLVPNVDWWLQRNESVQLTANTTGGEQVLTIQGTPVAVSITDGNGFIYRPDFDYIWLNSTTIQMSAYTAPGQAIYAEGQFRLDPTANPIVNPENKLSSLLASNETLAPGQVFYQIGRGNFVASDLTLKPDGSIYLTQLLDVNDSGTYELRVIQPPQVGLTASKVSGNLTVMPGLMVVFGDKVEVNDQCAILVSPAVCETYEIYGGKEQVSFDLTFKSNDYLTSFELASMARNYLRVQSRDRLTSLGVHIQKVSTADQGDAKDENGVTSTFKSVLSVEAWVDWEYHNPLINRVDSVDVSGVEADVLGISRPYLPEVAVVGGLRQFLTFYQ